MSELFGGRGIWLLFAALLVAACGKSEVFVLPSPDFGDAAGVLLVIIPEAGDPSVVGFEPSGSAPIVVPGLREVPERGAVVAMLYSCPLDSFGVNSGVLPVVETGLRIPPSARALRLELADTSDGWRSTDPRDERLADIRIQLDPAARCPRFSIKALNIPGPRRAIYRATMLSDDRVLILTDTSTAIAVDLNGDAFEIALPNAAPRGAFDSGSGGLFTLSRNGEFYRNFEDGFEPLAPLESREPNPDHRFLVATRGSNPYPVFSGTLLGNLEAFDGVEWRTLSTFAGGEQSGIITSLLARVSQTEVFAISVGLSYAHVTRAVDGIVEQERLSLFSPEAALSAITYVEGTGVIAGNREGRVFIRTDAKWVEYHGGAVADRVRVLAPLDEGIIFGGEEGALWTYSDFTGECSELSASADKFNHFIVTPSGFVAAGPTTSDVYQLERLNPVEACNAL